ncbi:hypothetical protein GmHk_19G054133 [Glycine max]|nr:hypothetical protein GmHk_19G054133 [Glycine max]
MLLLLLLFVWYGVQLLSIFDHYKLMHEPFICHSGQILSCTLWDRSYAPSVSNSLRASKLLINEAVLEIQEFRESLSDLGIQVRLVFTVGDQGSSQVSGSSQLSSKDEFLSKVEAKTISDINNISKLVWNLMPIFFCQEIVCVTVSTINRIVMDNHSWCYPACSYCHRKTDVETVAFTCACGKHNDQPVLRYRVEVMVTHKEQSTNFLMWDYKCIELIGQSANEVNKLKIEEGDIDLNFSPLALDKLLGYVLAFKIKVQPKFNNVVVLRYSNDLDLINAVVDMLPDAEVMFLKHVAPIILISVILNLYLIQACSNVHAPILDSDDPSQLESQSVSDTTDHDPLLGLPLKPTKRFTSDDCDDEPKASQISPAQLSSNKLARHDQIE